MLFSDHSYEECPSYPWSLQDHPEAKDAWTAKKEELVRSESQRKAELGTAEKKRKEAEKEAAKPHANLSWAQFLSKEHERVVSSGTPEEKLMFPGLTLQGKNTPVWLEFCKYNMKRYKRVSDEPPQSRYVVAPL